MIVPYTSVADNRLVDRKCTTNVANGTSDGMAASPAASTAGSGVASNNGNCDGNMNISDIRINGPKFLKSTRKLRRRTAPI